MKYLRDGADDNKEYTWWEPYEIHYSREQVDWLLEYLPLLIDGNYPPAPSDYAELNGRSFKCSFWVAARIATELTIRIKACGLDGYLAIEHYAEGKSLKKICQSRSLDEGKMETVLNRVKSYISSHRDNFPWVDKNFRGKISKGRTYDDYCKNWRER